MCEYGFLAARARSTENAAIAKSSTPPRGGKTGHSCKAQQDKSVELTDCGTRTKPLSRYCRLLRVLCADFGRVHFVNRPTCWTIETFSI